MRELTINLGGTKFTLVANFTTSVKIAEEVEDPMLITREGLLESMMIEKGFPYEPKWRFDVSNIVDVLYIGIKAADPDAKRVVVENAVFDAGFYTARDCAVEYLGKIIGPSPEVILPDASEDEEAGNEPG